MRRLLTVLLILNLLYSRNVTAAQASVAVDSDGRLSIPDDASQLKTTEELIDIPDENNMPFDPIERVGPEDFALFDSVEPKNGRFHRHNFSEAGECDSWGPPDLTEANMTPVPRVDRRKLSKRSFKTQYLDKGIPVIITNGLGDVPSAQWNCSTFIRDHPKTVYHSWHTGPGPIANTVRGDQNTIRRCTAGYIQTSDSDHTEDFGPNKEYITSWLRALGNPEWLEDDPRDPSHASRPDGSRWENAVFFIGSEGTGVTPHLDEDCSTFLSFQISGIKQWSFSRPVITDGELVWSEPWGAVTYPGDIVVWYSSWKHHTEVLKGCSIGVSATFAHPAPESYHRELLELYSKVGADTTDIFYVEPKGRYSEDYAPPGSPFHWSCGGGDPKRHLKADQEREALWKKLAPDGDTEGDSFWKGIKQELAENGIKSVFLKHHYQHRLKEHQNEKMIES